MGILLLYLMLTGRLPHNSFILIHSMKNIYKLLLFSFISVPGIAQDSVQNNGPFQIHSGGTVSGFGHFVNMTGSQFINGGALTLKRNLVNEEVAMSAGTGVLILNGSLQQRIYGTQLFKTFDLNTDNTAGIVLNNDLSVSGTHTFTTGLLSTAVTPNYLIYESGAGYTGDNDSKHVNGWVRKNGADDFSFPVGDGVYERKAGLTSLSGISVFDCRYIKPTFNIYNLMSPLVQVKENEYWQINKQSGGTARITLNWDHSRVAMNHVLVNEILVAYYTSGQWTSVGGTASGNVLTTGSITSNSIANFGSHTLGYTNFPLPLRLIRFTGVRNNGISLLNWHTDNESNVAGFNLERSFNGVVYSSVGQISAKNSGNPEEYRFPDQISYSGNAYYRLKITDLGGKSSYSPVVVLSEAMEGADAFSILNPAQSEIKLLAKSGINGQFKYRLLNMAGQLFQEGSFQVTSGETLSIPLNQYVVPGIYQLEIKSNKSIQLAKLLIH